MAIDPKTLFKIVGEEGPALRRVEEAMEWLLSHKAEGIGQQLLQEAHELHGKPLTIAVSQEASNGYLPVLHTIRINPLHMEKVTISAADGTSHLMSVERCLGHEMKHATQARVQEGAAELMALDAKISESLQSHLTPEQKTAQHEPMIKAMQASDYETAHRHLEAYVDQVVLPNRKAVEPQLFAHPDHIKYVQEFEMPAIEVENRIAVLRGEPTRTDFTSSHQIDSQKKRQMMLGELLSILELDKKPRLATEAPQRTDGQSWASSLGDRTGRKLG
jgi:hypothetical protein